MEKRSAVETPRITLSVVTYNNAHCLPKFLESLERQTCSDWEACFFDNASTDHTVNLLEEWGRGNIERNADNIGYSSGHNRNLKGAGTEYLVILNADVELAPDALRKLAQHLDEHPRDAMAGPQVLEGHNRDAFPPRYFYPGEGMIALSGGIRRREIAWINGCCFIIRRSVFETIRGFDEDFFLYQAETDLCLRARREGHTVGHCRAAHVVHLHRQSQRESDEYEYARRVFDGSAVFWTKHYSADDVHRMARFQYAISSLLLSHGELAHRVTGLHRELSAPRLRARRDVCHALLGQYQDGMNPWSPRILARQARLGIEWVLRRRFPVDDY
jgi:GT2 family glycosyltransferase